jgi:hypothetical protein
MNGLPPECIQSTAVCLHRAGEREMRGVGERQGTEGGRRAGPPRERSMTEKENERIKRGTEDGRETVH